MQSVEAVELKKVHVYYDLERTDIHARNCSIKTHLTTLQAVITSEEQEKGDVLILCCKNNARN